MSNAKKRDFQFNDWVYRKYWEGVEGKTCYLSYAQKGVIIELTQHANGLWTYHVEYKDRAVCTSLHAANEMLGIATKYYFHQSARAAHEAALQNYNDVKNNANSGIAFYYPAI